MKPLVAIVGRPNVGKSMLFNKLCGQRLSIVEDVPGVTRDRLYAQCEWRNRTFDIVDTGGIEPGTDDQILSFMREQAEIAINTATVIIFVCDIRTGMTAADQDVANMLRAGERVFLDDVSLDDVERELSIPAIPVAQDGYELLDAICGIQTAPPCSMPNLPEDEYYRYNPGVRG